MKRALPLVLVLLAACVPSKRREVDSPTWLNSGEVLILGRVKLTPPLTTDEQALSWLVSDWRGKIMVVVGDAPTPIVRPFKTSEYSGRIEAPQDREFSVALPSESFFIRGCVVPLDVSGGPTDQAILPGGFRVEVRPGDVALYLGTLHYTRDEFWNITKVEVEDDYDRVQSEYLKRWGGTVPPRKALLSPSGVELKPRSK